jgi:hypothetical protein
MDVNEPERLFNTRPRQKSSKGTVLLLLFCISVTEGHNEHNSYPKMSVDNVSGC